MYSIYKITNEINEKVYIGQTAFGIEKRFKEHIKKAQSLAYVHRPLYNAMNKYGIDKFHIELVEDGLTKEEANRQEKYWIAQYDSFKGDGYNATIGGDDGGTHSMLVCQIDMNTLEILHTYDSTRDAARTFGKNNAPINRVCLRKSKSVYGFYWCYLDEYEDFLKYIKNEIKKEEEKDKPSKVEQYDLTNNKTIRTYKSAWEAEKDMNIKHGHIKRVCNGERKSCHGYGWRYVA